MKILEMKHIEDCLDGSFIKEILFDAPLSKEFIHHLGQAGTFHYFDSFARPFFKVRKEDFYELKGVEGNYSVRILLKKPLERSLEDFRTLIAEYEIEEKITHDAGTKKRTSRFSEIDEPAEYQPHTSYE